MNLSAEDLHIETDDNGFILGQSFIGDKVMSEANLWREVRTDFSNLTLTRSVSVEKGVLFRPEAASLSLRTPTSVYMSGVFGRRVRIRWKEEVLFIGEIKSATLSSQAEHEGDNTYMNLTAVGLIERINNFVLYDYERPQETVVERVINAVGLKARVWVRQSNRMMAARPLSNVKLLTVIQEATDAQLARVYVNKQNELIVDGAAVEEPIVTFSDDHSLPGHVCYRNVGMAENLANTITGVIVEAKQDETIYAVNRHQSAVVNHEETYQIDLPLDLTEVVAWAQSFPLLGYTRLEPSNIDTFWQDGLAALELTQLVSIKWKGNSYRSGVRSIDYDITPDHEGGLTWNVHIGLMPGHLIEVTSVLAPSEPNDFTVSNMPTDPPTGYTDSHRLSLSWKRPALPNGMNGYELRYAEGPVPPASRTDGVLIGTFGGEVISYVHTGLKSNTDHSYSLWATTSNPAITSKGVTGSQPTPETIPTAVTDLQVFKVSATSHVITWRPPVTPGEDLMDYVMKVHTDGYPTQATYDGRTIVAPPGETFYNYQLDNLLPNAPHFYSVWARTNGLIWGPVAQVRSDTNETLPGPVRNLTATPTAYNNIHLHWDDPAVTGDLDSYVVRWDYNNQPTLSTGHAWTTVNKAVHDLDFTAEGATTYGFGIWPVTKGNLYGESWGTVTTTPQGVFNKYWEGEAVWTGSYKADNSLSGATSADLRMYYGYGDSFNGNQRSMAGWALPAEVFGAYAVDKVELSLYNIHTYNNSGADCWFGVHSESGKPATFRQEQGGQAIYHLNKPGWLDVDATGWLAGHLRNGAKGITLGPAPSNSSAYYGYAAGAGGPRPVIRVWYRTLGS